MAANHGSNKAIYREKQAKDTFRQVFEKESFESGGEKIVEPLIYKFKL